MINTNLIANDPCKASYILSGKATVHFSILSKAAVHQVVWALDTGYLKTVRHHGHKYLTANLLLTTLQKGFYISHYRIEYLTLV